MPSTHYPPRLYCLFPTYLKTLFQPSPTFSVSPFFTPLYLPNSTTTSFPTAIPISPPFSTSPYPIPTLPLSFPPSFSFQPTYYFFSPNISPTFFILLTFSSPTPLAPRPHVPLQFRPPVFIYNPLCNLVLSSLFCLLSLLLSYFSIFTSPIKLPSPYFLHLSPLSIKPYSLRHNI